MRQLKKTKKEEIIKSRLEVNDTMKFILTGVIGVVFGFIFSLLIQSQYDFPIETWLIGIGIIFTIFVIMAIFSPLIMYASTLVGFSIGIMIALYFYTFFPEILGLFIIFPQFDLMVLILRCFY